jgi:hypothetical protein
MLGALQNGHGVRLIAQKVIDRLVRALRPETTGLAQPGLAPLGLLLLQEGIDPLADRGALAAATAQG